MAATADAHSGILPLANRRPGLQHHRRRANSWPWEGADQQRILPFMVGSSSEPLCVGCSSAARATRGNAESLSPLRSSAVAGDSVASDIMTSEVIEDENQFYSKARTYWKRIPPTVDGMLGGYGHISNIDLNSSRKFLQRFLREGPNKTGTSCALDCGAGIGRITKRLLLPLFKVVDMVDVTEDFLAQAKTYLGEEGKRVRNYFCCGLQDFSPEPSSYDVIWIQWVIGHLTDQHLADFLRRCKRGLRPNGIIVIKDNMAQEGVILDDVDSSVCRDLEVVRRIIRSAGLSLLAEERQENLPDEIYHVYSFALR